MPNYPQILTDAAQCREYALAGNSTFTLKSKATEQHFTFRVRKPKEGDAPVRFVQVMTGSDNESSYSYMGAIFLDAVNPNNQGAFRRTAKSRIDVNAPSHKAFTWFWGHVQAGNVPNQLEVMRSNKCCRCGRKLTNPVSIETGIGPECGGRV